MEFYDFDEIKAAGSCLDYAKNVLGLRPVNGHDGFNIPWRPGSDSGALSISETGWHDFVSKESGSILDLVERAEGIDMIAVQRKLGEYYSLEPRTKARKDFHPGTRYQDLIDGGYTIKKVYPYVDRKGETQYEVVRLEHPTKSKEFLQRTPQGWGLRGIEMLLYNIPDWINSSWVCVVEGEKDAETLKAHGIPATTNSGGSKKWQDDFAMYFNDKDVIILYDNDLTIPKGASEPVGIAHAKLVASKIKDNAKTIRMTKTSEVDKGDVTDYFNEGKTPDDLQALIASVPAIKVDELQLSDDYNPVVQDAKQANKIDLCNFTAMKAQKGNKEVIVKEPRQINDLIKDVHRRFIGFPKKVGEQLFDHDRDTGRISYLYSSAAVFAWIQRKSNKLVKWDRGCEFSSKQEVHEGLMAEAERYESISYVPDWPKRRDVYYAHDRLPEPSEGHHYFNQFVEFFNPANAEQETFLKAFIAAPLYYMPGIPKPSWIIDSVDGAGVGKTTLVETISSLYQSGESLKGGIVRTNPQELKQNIIELTRRLISSEGRLSRMVLIDNVTGNFHCPALADMITAATISGKAPYGKGEESRPNNLNYVITANSANVDNDIAIRSYYILLKKPSKSVTWKTDVMNYIKKNRLNIIADIIDILNQGSGFSETITPCTRYPEFEEKVLCAMCGSFNEYNDAIKALQNAKAETNTEEEDARCVEERIRFKLMGVGVKSDEKVFIRTEVIKKWCADIFPDIKNLNSVIQYIRNMSKNGTLPEVRATTREYPRDAKYRRSGIMWGHPERGEKARIIGVDRDGKPTEITTI